jgi:dolichyl-phosphate beta-glucosyltransferase
MRSTPVHLSILVAVPERARDLDVCVQELEQFQRDAPVRCELVFLDDRKSGSPAHLRSLATLPDVLVLPNERHRPAAYSVKRGMLAALGRYRVLRDADSAYPLHAVWRIVETLEQGADVASARTEGLLGFRHLFDPGEVLKGYTSDAARAVFQGVSMHGFGFTLECLFIARKLGLKVEQVTVPRLRDYEIPGAVIPMADGPAGPDTSRRHSSRWVSSQTNSTGRTLSR